jgi:hypothetical protein
VRRWTTGRATQRRWRPSGTTAAVGERLGTVAVRERHGIGQRAAATTQQVRWTSGVAAAARQVMQVSDGVGGRL